MNILLTNDDGIDCPGLALLAGALRKRKGDRILVLAPDRERSGVSHSLIFLYKPIRLMERGTDMWSASGNPADCVSLALMGALPVKPDMVVSGINRGANLGTDLLFSGTAAAARHAALCGIPGIALSLAGKENWQWDTAVKWTAENLDAIAARAIPDVFVNVNIPNTAEGPGGMLDAFPSKRFYNDQVEVFRSPGRDDYCFVRLGEVGTVPEPGSDCDIISRNMAALSTIYVHPVEGPIGK